MATLITPAPQPGMWLNPLLQQDTYKFLYELWQRSGGLTASTSNLTGLTASVDELNTLDGVNTNETVQQQLNARELTANLKSMAFEDSSNVSITGGNISSVTASGIKASVVVGTSVANAIVGGTIHIDTAPISNSGGTPTQLMHYLLLANSLSAINSFIEINAFGSFAANVNNKQLQLLFDSTILIDSGNVPINGTSWQIQSTVIGINLSSQIAITNIIADGTLILTASTLVNMSKDLTANLLIECVATGVSSGDIVQNGMIIKYY